MNPYQRNAIDVAHMVGHVKRVKFFQSMPIHVTEAVCRVAQYKKIQTDYCICKQNEEGDSFFVLLGGSVSVHVLMGNNEGSGMKGGAKTQSSIKSKEDQYGMKVAVMTSGMCFGEVALICGQKRSASILAQEESELLIITKEDYFRTLQRVMSTVFLPDSVKNCMHTKPALRRESEWVLIADIVQHHAFFDKIPREVLLEVCKTMQFLVLETKNRIYKQGDQARFLYIILTGTVELYRKSDTKYMKNQSHQTAEALSTNQHVYGGSSVPIGDIDIGETYGNHLMTLSSGDCFGDTELYDGGNRNKTALTMDKTEMIVIDKMALMKLTTIDRALCMYPDRIRRLLGVQPNKRKPEDLKSLMYYTEALTFMSALTEANAEVVMAILRIAGSTAFSAGEVIVRQGERGSQFYIIFSGTVTMHQRDSEGGNAVGSVGASSAISAGAVSAAGATGDNGSGGAGTSAASSSASGAATIAGAGAAAAAASGAGGGGGSTGNTHTGGTPSKSEKRGDADFPGFDPALSPAGKETIGKYGPCIRTITVGEGFGELNLINEDIGEDEIHSSTATCVAATDVFAMTLGEKDYNRIVRHAHEQETTEKMALLRQTQGLYSVPYNKLLRLCLHMTLETFHRGATLVDEGAPCKDIYFIKEGECRVGMTRSDPLEVNSLAAGNRRRTSFIANHNKHVSNIGGLSQREFEVALVGPCETVGDYAFFNGVLQPSTVRATRTTMAYKLSIDSLEKNVPLNILDGLREVSTQRMHKQRDRFLQATAIRQKIKISATAIKQQSYADADGLGLEDEESTFSSIGPPSIPPLSKSPDISSSTLISSSRSSSRLPNLRLAHTAGGNRTMTKLSKTIEAALSAFRSTHMAPTSTSKVHAAAQQPQNSQKAMTPSARTRKSALLTDTSSSPVPPATALSNLKVRRKFNVDRGEGSSTYLPSGPPDPLRERSVVINRFIDGFGSGADGDDGGVSSTGVSGGMDGSVGESSGSSNSSGSNRTPYGLLRRLEYDSRGRRVRDEGLKMFEVDVPNSDTGCARLRYIFSNSAVPRVSEEYKRQLVYDYTREHLRKIAKKKKATTTTII